MPTTTTKNSAHSVAQLTAAPKAEYRLMRQFLESLMNDLEVLAGDRMGPADATVSQMAWSASTNAYCLARQLRAAAEGKAESFVAFPSPAECMEAIENDGKYDAGDRVNGGDPACPAID